MIVVVLLFIIMAIYLMVRQSKTKTINYVNHTPIDVYDEEAIEVEKQLSAEELEELFWTTKIDKSVFVAGYQYNQGPQIKKKLQSGVNLELVRDLENQWDDRAIKVMLFDHLLGFISKSDNKDISRKMDEGILFTSFIVYFDNSERKPYFKLFINVSEI